MDLIEDVSRASHNLMIHELLNTNTGFLLAEDEFALEEQKKAMLPRVQPMNSPTTSNGNAPTIPQNTSVGFHRGGGYQKSLEPLIDKMLPEVPQTSRNRKNQMGLGGPTMSMLQKSTSSRPANGQIYNDKN